VGGASKELKDRASVERQEVYVALVTPLLCGAGSTAYLNGNGHPFCCGPRSTGCRGLCVDPNLRDSILMSGRQCNGVAPQGLQTPGRIQYLGIPWDGQLQRYKCGENVAIIDGMPFPRGTNDFTVTATITPRRDGQIAVGRFAVLLYRLNNDVERPVALYFGYDDTFRNFDVFLGTDLEQVSNVQGIFARYEDFRANVSVTVKFIRQGRNFTVVANDTVLAHDTEPEIFSFNNSLSFPIVFGPPTFPTTSTNLQNILTAMDADVSDIAISDIAYVPQMAPQVST